MLSSYFGYWQLWQLYHSVTFDGVNKLIIVNPGVTTLDVGTDIYSSWKEWALIDDYIKFEQAMTVSGGEPTTNNEALGTAYFLINGWKIRPYEGNYELAFIGNLYSEDGSNPITHTNGSSVLITRTVSNIVTQLTTPGPSALTAEQAAELTKILKNTNFSTALLLSK